MEADKVRNWVRGRDVGVGTASQGNFRFITVQMPGKGKEEPCDVIDMAGALLVSDPNDARDIIGLGRMWACLARAQARDLEQVGPASKVLVSIWAKAEIAMRGTASVNADLRRIGAWAMKTILKSASNASRSPPPPFPSVPTLSYSSSFASSSSPSSSIDLAQYLLVATTPWPSSVFTCPTARAAMHTYTIRFVTIFFLITSQSVSCTLRSRARVHAHWHTFVLVVENVVLAIVGMAQSCRKPVITPTCHVL
jgi:hypothetical protein